MTRCLAQAVRRLVPVMMVFPLMAFAGGTPEEAFLIADPARTDAMYVANYYVAARDIPPANVLYMDPTAPNYATFAADNADALLGTLSGRAIRDHIDYVVIPPASTFYVPAAGYVYDECSPVNRFSLSGAYTTIPIRARILQGNLTATRENRYYTTTNTPLAFDSQIQWYDGLPNETRGHYYFIGAYLGYTGERGNTLTEILSMIDRSVSVDATDPNGTFYFMETTDPFRSPPRDPWFTTVVNNIINLGGNAEHLEAVLPTGAHDCLGIMTGAASPDIDGTDLAILPGAFCDHLTSYAGKFDTSSQTKMSRWIANGASGSWGAVEEPCNYGGKFPHARMHLYYYYGMSLGEAVFRSVGYVPLQGLLYGDPLTRPFAVLPDVDVADAPSGTVSGVIALTPTATTAHPTAQIALLDLLIDGVLHASILPGEQFVVDTAELDDGWHDLRVLAMDDLDQRFTGRWVGNMTTNNRGRAATLDITPDTGDWNTAFSAQLATAGDDVDEVRLIHNGRVVAAATGGSAQLDVHGLTLGAGPVRVQAEALFVDGACVRSAPMELIIDYAGASPSGQPPAAFSYTKVIPVYSPTVVELPATFDDADTALTYAVLSAPTQATLVSSSGPYRLLRADPLAEGTDTLTFEVSSAAGASNVATVTLVYSACVGDLDENGRIDLADLQTLLANYGATEGVERTDGDLDLDGDVDLADLQVLLAHYGEACG